MKELRTVKKRAKKLLKRYGYKCYRDYEEKSLSHRKNLIGIKKNRKSKENL